MKTEKGVIIAAYKQDRYPRFIVLNRKKNWEGWELPKGHLENGDYKKTVHQELKEEAGIEEDQIREVKELDHTTEWTFEDKDEEIKREYRGFLVRLDSEAFINVENNPHDEHEQGFFFRKEDAGTLLTYENQVEFLEFAASRIDD